MNNNMQQQLEQIRNNPQQFIQQAGWNIPQEMMNNPQAMVMHLIQTGQVGGQKMQQIMQMARNMMGR